MKFGFIAKYREVWPVRWLCDALEVTCAGFYAWLTRPESRRACVDRTLSAAIQRSFSDSDRTYGARRVRRDLLNWGHRCGIHRVEGLMRRSQLIARRRRRRLPFDIGPRPEHSIAPNLLARRFDAVAANRKWVADFTLPVDRGGLAVCSRRDGFVLSTYRRLVDELANDGAVGQRRDADGDLASRSRQSSAASL